MSALTISFSELEDLAIEGEVVTAAGVNLRVIKEGVWESAHKYETKTLIFTDGERFYSGTVSRSGSYFTDYTWESEWNSGTADITEVAEVPVTKKEWQPVLERGVFVTETDCPEEGAYCLSIPEFERMQAMWVAEFGEEAVSIISPAVRTASGWYPYEKEADE